MLIASAQLEQSSIETGLAHMNAIIENFGASKTLPLFNQQPLARQGLVKKLTQVTATKQSQRSVPNFV